MVLQTVGGVLLASWLAGTAGTVDGAAICTTRSVLRFVTRLYWLIPGVVPGSVSVGVWQMACRRVLKVGERVVRDVLMTGEYVQFCSYALIKMALQMHLKTTR
jgi:hypothetical protein